MLRRTPIFTALDPALLASGLTPDIQAVRAPLWVAGQGVEFIDGKIRNRRENQKLLHVEQAPVRGMEQQRLSNGEVALWFVQNDNLYRWDQFSLGLQKTYEPGEINRPYYDFVSYGDWLFINRGFGPIDWWNGATFSVLPEMPQNVVQLMKHLSFMIALGIGSRRTGVGWSDATDISTWVSAADNTAGTLYIEEFEGGIVAGEYLGPVLAVYSANQMAVVSFIGSPFFFGYKPMLTGIGAVGPEAVTSVNNMNYGVSRQGIWQTNGQEFQYIDRGKLHTYLQDNVNWSAAHKIIAVRNDILRTVEFHFPVGNSFELNEGWSFDPAAGGWSKIQPISFFNQDIPLGLPVKASESGEIAFVGAAPFETRPMLLQTKPMLMHVQSAMGLTDVHFACKVDEIELLLHAAQNCQMRIGSSTEHNGIIHWSDYIPLDLAKSTYTVPAGVPDGIYWHLEFTATTVIEDVVENGVLVTEDGEQVVAMTAASAWHFNLQGFLLFGTVGGAKIA